MRFQIVRDPVEVGPMTRGTLTAGDLTLRTLELAANGNVPTISCIPAGTYPVVLAWSNRYQKVMPRLIGVPGREGILLHAGNSTKDTSGCILVGMKDSKDGVAQSRPAFVKFFNWLAVALREGNVEVEVKYAG